MNAWLWRTFLSNLVVEMPWAEMTGAQKLFTTAFRIVATAIVLAAFGGLLIVIGMLLWMP